MTLLLFVAPAIVAALLAYGLTPVARRLAFRVGAVDEPGPRVHSEPAASLPRSTRRRLPVTVHPADRAAALPAVNTFAFLLLVLFLGLIPFPYGAVTPTGTVVLQCSAFAIGALKFLSLPRRSRIGLSMIPLSALVLTAALGAIQLVPLSINTSRSIAPLSAKVYSDANEIFGLFGRKPIAARISIAPWNTQVVLLLTLAYAVLFVSAAILANTRRQRRIAVAVFLASVVVHILYSTATTAAEQRLHGTYINPNHFAGYLQIALAFAFGIVLREILHSRERASGIVDMGERFEKRALPLVAPVLLFGVLAAGIGLTRSGGGILAAALTTILLLVIAPLHQARSGRRRMIAIALMKVLSRRLTTTSCRCS